MPAASAWVLSSGAWKRKSRTDRTPGTSNPPPASGTAMQSPPLLSNPTTVALSSSNRNPALDDNTDYIILAPTPIYGPVTLDGGRRVVMDKGFDIECPGSVTNRPLYLLNQTEFCHVEGGHIWGDAMKEGIDIAQNFGASVAVLNTLVETVYGTYETDHADVLQCWSMMPNTTLLIDRLDGTTNYQGFMIQPDNFGDGTGVLFDIRRTILRHAPSNTGILVLLGNISTKYSVACSGLQLVQSSGTLPSWWNQNGGNASTQIAGVTVHSPQTGTSETPVLVGSPGLGYIRPEGY